MFGESLLSEGPLFAELVEKHTRFLSGEQWSPEKLGDFFDAPSKLLTQAHVDYWTALSALSTRQGVIDHFRYRGRFSLEEREEQLIAQDDSILRSGGLDMRRWPLHELRHSLIALLLSSDKTSLNSLTPYFRKIGPDMLEASKKHYRSTTWQRQHQEESLTVMLDQPKKIRKALSHTQNSVADFMKVLDFDVVKQGTPVHAVAKALHSRNAFNPMFLLDFGVDVTTPLMRRHASEVTEALLGKAA